MKVLQIITSLGIGGAEKLVSDIAIRMHGIGIDCDVMVLNGLESHYLQNLDRNGVKVIKLSRGPLYSVYNPLLIFKIMPFLKCYDLIHVHLFPAQYWAIIAKWLSRVKIPIITTEHNTTNRRWESIFFKALDKRIYKSYDKVVCISKEIQAILIVLLNEQEVSRFPIIENGIDLGLITQAHPYDKKKLIKDPTCESLIVNVAGFREQKDQDTLIRAMKLLPSDTHLALVGDGVRRESLEKLVQLENVESRVHFLGIRSDIPQILKTADIVTLSSHYEGLSLSSLEGMASGKPFIASRVNGLKELVEGVGLLFNPGDEYDFKDKVCMLRGNSEFKAEIVNKCRLKSEEYGIDKTCQSYVSLYQKLLK